MLEIILSVVKSEAILAALIGAVASLMAALLSQYSKKVVEKRLQAEKEKIRQDIAGLSLDLGIFKTSKTVATRPLHVEESIKALMQKMEQQILERVYAVPDMTKEQVKEEVRKETQEFGDKVEKIARRFPEDAQLDKIASVSDAILSERVDRLSERIDALEGKILSHWDVATTVSTIIGGIFAVVAAAYALIILINTSAK